MGEPDRKTPDAQPSNSRLANLESWSKILAAIAIPVVIAIGGWVIQDSVSRQATGKDYVNLALSILQKKPQNEEERRITNWAVDLINSNSPVKFDVETTQLLKAGTVNLGARLSAVVAAQSGSGFAVSLDSKLMASGNSGGIITLFDRTTGHMLSRVNAHEGAIYALAFAPDGRRLVSGGADNTARIFDMLIAKQLRVVKRESAVIGVAFSDDGKNIVVRNRSTITIFDGATGSLLMTISEPE